METTCIRCPLGCLLNVTKKGNEIIVTGNKCFRGEEYGKEEFVCPKRIITTLIKTDSKIYSVKTTSAVEKDKLSIALKAIGKLQIPKNAKIRTVLTKNLLKQGITVVITGVNSINTI